MILIVLLVVAGVCYLIYIASKEIPHVFESPSAPPKKKPVTAKTLPIKRRVIDHCHCDIPSIDPLTVENTKQRECNSNQKTEPDFFSIPEVCEFFGPGNYERDVFASPSTHCLPNCPPVDLPIQTGGLDPPSVKAAPAQEVKTLFQPDSTTASLGDKYRTEASQHQSQEGFTLYSSESIEGVCHAVDNHKPVKFPSFPNQFGAVMQFAAAVVNVNTPSIITPALPAPSI
jgi:hypothetical protein